MRRLGPTLDDRPFLAYGARGMFAFGFLAEAQGDGERAAWTLLPKLPGIELRPATSGPREPYSRKATVEDGRLADLMVAEACEAYAMTLDRCLPRLAAQWRAKMATPNDSWRRPIQRAQFAFYGGPTTEDAGLQLAIDDAAREHDFRGLLSASSSFGHLVWNRSEWPSDDARWQARRCGEFFADAVAMLGEDGWAMAERLMQERPCGS